MTPLEVVKLRPLTDTHRRADCEGRPWLRSVEVLTAGAQPVTARTAAAVESGLIVLSGTHDLQAGAGSWAARGLRASPYEGRPVALFLPPGTPFSASGGRGDLLLVSVQRAAAAQRKEPPGMPPLLPIAGSNKFFDAKTGDWQRLETLPDSPEAILPRHIARVDAGGVQLERIFAFDYKASALCLDEARLERHQSIATPGADFAQEHAVYYRTEQPLEVVRGDQRRTLAGEGVVLDVDGATFTAGTGRAYLLFVAAGPKQR
jgi:hypothetical protein